jgi:small subunit ribosomal protein S1
MASSSKATAFSHDDFVKALEHHDYHAEKGQTVRGKVSQHSSDGVYVDFGGKSPGFLSLREVGLNAQPILEEELPLGSEWDFLVISEQNADGQVQLSRRQLQLQEAWDNIASAAEQGKSLELLVTGVNRGGVTGDVAGLRGFIPRSHLVEKDNPEGLVGQIITAEVLEANRDNNKLVLSQRNQLKAAAMSQIAKGSIVAGRVVKIQPYGVFVDLNGVTGLLHITQMSGARISDLNTLFSYGQSIQVMVLDIDEYKNRISLTTKILEAYPGELVEKFAEMMADIPNRLADIEAKLAQAESQKD